MSEVIPAHAGARSHSYQPSFPYPQNPPIKGKKKDKKKKGKKNKKAKKIKLDSTVAFDLVHVYPEGLRPGDMVLCRERKSGKPKPHDEAYTVLKVTHFNGQAEVDFHMASPDRILVVAENWDGSLGQIEWKSEYGSEAIGNANIYVRRQRSAD